MWERDGVRMRWERHTEMSAFAVATTATWDEPFTNTAIEFAPDALCADAPGSVIAAAHLEARPRNDSPVTVFGAGNYACGRMLDGALEARSDFRIGPDGFVRILLHSAREDTGLNGRFAQLLLELDAYRMAALLAFPVAQSARDDLAEMEAELSRAMADLADGGDPDEDRELLAAISNLAARSEALGVRAAYRFAGARAYHRLVLERIEALGETHGDPGRPTLGGFLQRRLSPAMRTCESVEKRQEAFADRVDRATRLLSARVQVTSEEQNADLLKAMNRRAGLQLRLQEAVEGLSVFAISYYALGLVAAGFKALEHTTNLDAAVATGLAAPIVFGLVWFGLRLAKTRLDRDPD
jgi:uncharacterized membrane-anchored protein